VAAKQAGFDVAVATHVDRHGERIREAGLRLIPIRFTRSGLHPLNELRSLRELTAIYRREAPDLVHHVSLKPVLFGTLAAHRTGTPAVINAIMGLGWVFSSDSLKARAMRPLVRAGLRWALAGERTRVIVQNSDDANGLIGSRLIIPDHVRLIRGSGVDPAKYSAEPSTAQPPLVILPARLIEAKGVLQFIEAAAILKREGIAARFALVGKPDPGNPTTISPRQLEQHIAAGHVEYWGWRDDMPAVFRQASIVCLPTYYGEGLPKALLEAAAAARPIVATDVPGCREIVRPGKNGWLIEPRNTRALADALRQAIAQPALCAAYGAAGRRIVEREFSLDTIIRDTLAVYEELLPSPASGLRDWRADGADADLGAPQRVSSGARR
jgi:glycosyltransferase involved in cell wall biosynthesis